MPFGLKNAPSEFQNIMNDIFNSFSHFTIVYIDDVLVYSSSIDEHWKHLNSFLDTIKRNGLVLSAKKVKLFQTKVRFLGYDISEGQIHPIDRAIQFANKFPDVIIDKTQLQRFLGSLNYVADFYKDMRKQCKPLFDRLKSNPPPWSDVHTSLVKQIKSHVKTLPCLGIPTVGAFKIVETDVSDVGYGGILKQRVSPESLEQIVRFYSGIWNNAQLNYSTIKKEILSIVLFISKFQSDLLNQKFLLRIDCKSAKYVIEKDVENIVSKHIFAKWQAILSVFYFGIEYIKGSQNSIPDFLTCEFLQCQMASRRPKDNHPAKTSKQIVKKEPASPLDITNCFTTLGIIPRPNYSTVLASSYDPYAITPVNQPIKTIFPKNSPQYIKKQYFQHLFYLNPTESLFLILSDLLKVISLRCFIGFRSTEKRI